MKKTIFILLILSTGLLAQAQFQAGGNFTIGIPQDDFRKNVDNNAFGGTGFFFWNVPQSPVHLGASFGFLVYGVDNYERRLIPDVPVNVDITTTNSIFQGDLILRLQPTQNTVQPYMEGLIGFNYFATSTSIDDKGYDEYKDIASETNFDDGVFHYGGGAGVMFKVYNPTDEQIALNKIYGVFIDIGARYTIGGKAEYLKKGGIEYIKEDDIFVYDVQKSVTNLLTWHIGFSIAF